MRRIVIVSCALASAVVLAAGCGGKPFSSAVGGGTSGSATARLLAAVETTTAAHTADIAMTMRLTAAVPGAGSETVTLTGKGAMDFENRKADLSMTATVAGHDEQLEMRVLDGKEYVGENGRWTEVSTSSFSSNGGAVNASGGDPTQYLAYLEGVSSDVHTVGSEVIDGTDTTKYEGTIDVDKLLASASLSESQRESLRKTLETSAAHIGPMPFTAWLDDAGRVRRVNLTMNMSSGTSEASMDVTVDYSNFGAAVNVQPPPGVNDIPETPTTGAGAVRSARAASEDRATQSDLRNALTAEKVVYTDNQEYSASTDEMATIEGSLDWGGALHVLVSRDKQSVCLSETSKSGTTFAIADVAAGPDAGTYYNTAACPTPVTASALSAMNDASWSRSSTRVPVATCAQTEEETVKTAIEAYRAQHGDPSARPTRSNLVAGTLLQSNEHFTLTYRSDGTPVVTASC